MAGRSGGAAGLRDFGGHLAEVLRMRAAMHVPTLPTCSVRGAAQRDVALHAIEGRPRLFVLVMQAPTATALRNRRGC